MRTKSKDKELNHRGLRLTDVELDLLDQGAACLSISRSEYLRKLLLDIDNMYEFASSHCTDFKDLRDDEDIVINREWILNKLAEAENEQYIWWLHPPSPCEINNAGTGYQNPAPALLIVIISFF